MDPIRIYYSDAYCHQGASFDTHAKAQLVADRISSDKNVAMVAPDPASSDAKFGPRHLARLTPADR